ncbi:peptidase P60 [Photobacterium angustum]|uniref:Peptidase P60 n=1 Tax=Photobacterium angustum TaxID=661 RepID=A0A855SHA1_PHOAN|nr:NlpC/P60 family protein [Photobacterium angustum]KJF83142.1 peptidase P60 [Photobacterium damselae subsp. damselae]KJG29858.1 peptidase P60 [Photobacterium angustum]KJG43016.1 peptidase P60 [Photobacterium angustum]KJG47450.1 peptidase P60 [Photobacterium angustum]KJG49307.1 peptidase P60 [Photobacterium angustum]
MSSYRLKNLLKAKLKKTLLLSLIALPITASAHTHSENHIRLNKKHNSNTYHHVVTHHNSHNIEHKNSKTAKHSEKHETHHVTHKSHYLHRLSHSSHHASTKKHKIPVDYYTLKGHYVHHKSFWSDVRNLRLPQKWRSKIWHAYSHWAHTPYLYGGNSHHGIDCSAFVRRVFDEVYHVHLPRTTLQQVKLGYKVKKENLHYGDLVFFKTGGWHHHVGIYLDHGRFVNATSSRGVAISNINHPYWRKRLWQIRRLVDQYKPS